LVSDSIAYHDYDFNRNRNKDYYNEINKYIFILKNYSARTLMLLTPIIIINEIFVMVFFLFKKKPYIKFQSYASLILKLGKIYNKRQTIQKTRVINDRFLFDKLESKFPGNYTGHNILINFVNRLNSSYYKIITPFI
jgi:hypothetical protein